MTIEETHNLWSLAKLLHEARQRLAWGRIHDPFPDWTFSYTHHPIAFVDLALAEAKVATEYFAAKGDPT